MSVIEDLLSAVRSDTPDALAREVLVGLYWTAVCSRGMGLASTLFDATCCFARDVEEVGRLHERPAHELAAGLRSAHPLEVSIGMAALNSLIVADELPTVELNARELLIERGRGKNVALVGHFSFTEALSDAAAQLWVLEMQPGPGEYPAETAPQILPQAEVVGLTAMTLMNGTFEGLSKLFPPGALVVMLGPSTPLSPVLFDYGVDVLAGAQVADPATLLRYVGQGSALHGKVPGIRRLTMLKDQRMGL
jgi:uncharacterized protein (DUF4213/DUF364 family)